MRRLVANLALSAAAGLFALLLAELALRAVGYAPRTFRHTERVANGRRTLLLDCYPTNPRGYFDIDLRDEKVRVKGGATVLIQPEKKAQGDRTS